MKCWVEMLELDARVRRREAPVDPVPSRVAVSYPGRDFLLDGSAVGQAAVQTLALPDAQLDLSDVEPTAVLGRVMDLQLVRQALRLRGRERLVQRGRRMRVQLIHHPDDGVSVGKVHVDQGFDTVRPVDPRPLVAHPHLPPPAQRLAHEKEVHDARALVFRIVARGLAGSRRVWRAHLAQELAARFIQAHLRALRIVRSGVHVEHVLHVPDELGVGLGGDAPLLPQPGFEPVCFKTRWTVSYETLSTTSKRTSSLASRRKVQRACPAGGAPQAAAITWASSAPSALRGYTRSGGVRSSAARSPWVTYSRRTRETVAGCTSKAPAMAASVQPGPPSPWFALSRIRARVSCRAGAAPCPSRVRNCARSASESLTAYLVFTRDLLQGGGCAAYHDYSRLAIHA